MAALLPPGLATTDASNVHLSIYCFPVPDEPEYGVVVSVDASYRGTPGFYALAYAIDQESAVTISRDMNGQPKYLAEIEYYRMGAAVRARCSHHGYTFLEFSGKTTGPQPLPEPWLEHEWWIKVSRAVGGAEKSYDFPPHAVTTASDALQATTKLCILDVAHRTRGVHTLDPASVLDASQTKTTYPHQTSGPSLQTDCPGVA